MRANKQTKNKQRRRIRNYFFNIHGIIWVVDSNDRERCPLPEDGPRKATNLLTTSKEDLDYILGEIHEAKKLPLLVLANKQDLPNAIKMRWISFLHATSLKKWLIEDGIIRVIYDYLPGICPSDLEKMGDKQKEKGRSVGKFCFSDFCFFIFFCFAKMRNFVSACGQHRSSMFGASLRRYNL